MNPVYAGDEDDLLALADMLDDNDPVASFLASDEFNEVVPELVDNQVCTHTHTHLSLGLVPILSDYQGFCPSCIIQDQ